MVNLLIVVALGIGLASLYGPLLLWLGREAVTVTQLQNGGLIVLFVAPGLALMGFLIDRGAFMPLLGVAALVAFVGIGLLVAGKVLEKSKAKDAQYPPLG